MVVAVCAVGGAAEYGAAQHSERRATAGVRQAMCSTYNTHTDTVLHHWVEYYYPARGVFSTMQYTLHYIVQHSTHYIIPYSTVHTVVGGDRDQRGTD